MKAFKLILPIVAACTLAACAGKPTIGDAMRSHADQDQAAVDLQKKLAKDWERGSKLTQNGNKRVKNAQQELERGQKEVAEGTRLMEESERNFREAFPNLSFGKN